LADPAQSIRSPWAEFYRPTCDFKAVVLRIHDDYLDIRRGSRNKTAGASSAWRWKPLVMTIFDRREEAFEKKFAIDEEQKFKAEARRNRLLGLWVAEKLGLSGDAANAYARQVVAADFEGPGHGAARKVMGDLAAEGVAVTEPELRDKMDELMAQAIVQVRAGK
jgi:hypothetical protein